MLWPPYIRRPTTRLANCTGIRRWPDSTNTMPTTNPTAMTRITKNTNALFSAQMALPWDGSRLTTAAKIRSDMPLPIPRWVMSSPSHMMNAVPAVSVKTMSSTRQALKFGIRSRPRSRFWKKNPPDPLCRANTMPVDWSRARPTAM